MHKPKGTGGENGGAGHNLKGKPEGLLDNN
jgi:hypothetical protein